MYTMSRAYSAPYAIPHLWRRTPAHARLMTAVGNGSFPPGRPFSLDAGNDGPVIPKARNQARLEYEQGQFTQNKRRREYFYFLDHNGFLFLDDARMKNFTSAFKGDAFSAKTAHNMCSLLRMFQIRNFWTFSSLV